MLRDHDLHDLIERLERDGEYRVLRKLRLCDGHTPVPYDGSDTFIGAVVDVETTGFKPEKEVIIELAIRRFRFDNQGRILAIDRVWSWLEDPGRPLSAEITQLTGLTDAGLAGEQIDDAAAIRLLSSSHLIIAHNAAFDRKFIERRLPKAAGLPWACSYREVDWAGAGFDIAKLRPLLNDIGLFFGAHRASDDVDAVVALLGHLLPNGRTVLAELVERSSAPSMRIEAIGANIDVKDDLKSRGYRWDPDSKVWWKEVTAEDLPDEQSWLGHHVYGAGNGARTYGPRIIEVSARERFA